MLLLKAQFVKDPRNGSAGELHELQGSPFRELLPTYLNIVTKFLSFVWPILVFGLLFCVAQAFFATLYIADIQRDDSEWGSIL